MHCPKQHYYCERYFESSGRKEGNYLNIVLNQTDTNRAKLSKEELSMYRIFDGTIQDLVVKDDHDKWIVDTYDLAETMSNIYDEFVHLGVGYSTILHIGIEEVAYETYPAPGALRFPGLLFSIVPMA